MTRESAIEAALTVLAVLLVVVFMAMEYVG